MKHMQLYNITQNQQIIGPNPACCAWFFFGVCLRCHQIVSWNSQWFYAMTMNPWSLSMHQGTALIVQVGKWTSCSHDSLGGHSWKPLVRFPKKKTYSWWCILGDTEVWRRSIQIHGAMAIYGFLRISKKKKFATLVTDEFLLLNFNLPAFEMLLLCQAKQNQLQKTHTW